MDSASFQTQQIHAGQSADPSTRSITVPIYASTAFSFSSSSHLESLLSGAQTGFVYSRMHNPTCSVFEERMAVLEGGVGGVSAATGQAAMLLAVLALGKAGDNFVVRSALFGGTYQQWKVFLPRLGVTARFVPDASPASFAALIDHNTKGIFVESIANPSLEVLDIAEISKVAKEFDVPLIVDNTAGGGGYLIRPIELGADIVVHSATKWIAGHGSSMGGVVVSSGKYNFANNIRFPEFNEPLPGSGVILADVSIFFLKTKQSADVITDPQKGPQALLIKMRNQTLRDMGCSLTPFAAFQLLQGLETLSLRMEKHCSNALALALFLEKQEEVAWVSYPALPSHPSYATAQRLLKKGMGGVVSFGLKPRGSLSGKEIAMKFIDGCKMLYFATNLGDVRTLMIHPSTTTHRQLTPEEQLMTGTTPDLIRISVGIEGVEDILRDFEEGLKGVREVV